MADNTSQTGSDTIATDDIGGVKYQRVKATYGADGTATDVSDATPFPVTGGILVTASQAIAAAGTGTLGPVDVTRAGIVTFVVKNTTAASAWAGAPVLVFEQSDDGTSWAPLYAVRGDTGQVASTATLGPGIANSELMFDAQLEGVSQVRVRCTTGPTTNGLTITATTGGMPFTAGGSVIGLPSDGNKVTGYLTSAGTDTPQITAANTGQPWLTLNNPSTTTVIRVLRVRVGLTLATAATLQLLLTRYSAASTGGTAQARTPRATDAADSVVATANLYTAAPTSNVTGLVSLGYRRLWVGLSTAAGGPYIAEWVFGSGKPAKAIVLRPGHQLGVNWAAVPATAVAADYEIEFTEEPV